MPKTGYEYLLAYKITVPIYDYTVEFCKRWIDYKSRTKDQMEQAARSGSVNIAEGYAQKSLSSYIKLSGVAVGSQEELLKDYLSYARQHGIDVWDKDRVVREVRELREVWEILNRTPTLPNNPNFPHLPNNPTQAVNLMITLVNQATYLQRRLIKSLELKHTQEGGFSENLLKKRLAYRGRSEGFTLIELLIVVGLLGVLSLTFMGLFNPLRQFQKSYDGKRKAELDSLPKIFENIYNDKNRFPLPAEVCFDAVSSPRTDTYGKTACTCHICGKNPQSPPFSPYLSQLPCDPLSSEKEYLYDFDCAADPPDPQWFRVYTVLAIENDPDIKKVGCLAGCGPAPDYAYNYLVFANTQPETIRCSDSIRLYQKDEAGNCNICKSPVGGDICNYNEILYNSYPCNRRCSP